MGELRLSSTQYLRPGAYIGFVFLARPTSASGQPRYPSFVARGNRLARTRNYPLVRGRVTEAELTFSSLPPHAATLPYNAIPDKTLARLYTEGGTSVDSRYWIFKESDPGSGNYDQVEIEITRFDKNASYLIDYQGADSDKNDVIDITEMRDVIAVGDTEGADQYEENLDFRIVTAVTGEATDQDALVRDDDNSDGTGVVYPAVPIQTGPGGSTGSITFNTNSEYTYPYPLKYSLQCINTTSGPDTATFRITITHLDGGNDIDYPIPPHPSSNWTFDFTVTDGVDNLNYQLDQNYPFADGLRLDITFGAGPVYFNPSLTPASADVFEWEAWGGQLIEIPGPYFNTNQFSSVTEPEDFGNNPTSTDNTSSGNIEINPNTNYDSEYNREYYYEVLSVTAPAYPSPRTAVILWSAWGEDNTYGTISIDESNTSSLEEVSIEKGIFVDFDFGVRHLVADPTNAITSPDATDEASALTLAAEIRTDFNSHDSNGAAAAHNAPVGNHQITAPAPTNSTTLVTFCQDAQTQYVAHINDGTNHDVIDTVYLLDPDIDPTDLASSINFLNDYKAKFNRHIVGMNYVAGDSWLSVAKAPLQQYMGKDDREYTLTATTVTAATKAEFQYNSGTLEGGWGTVEATNSDLYLEFPDGITLAVRNWDPAGNVVQYSTSDVFTFAATNLQEIDWSLGIRVTESIPEASIRQDPFGRITYNPLSFYVTLTETPTEVINVVDAETGSPISYVWVKDPGSGNPLPVIMFATDPGTNLQVTYEYSGAEPTVGSTYYMTTNRLRLDDEYDTPIFYALREDASNGLRPIDVTNDAWIMTDIAFDTSFFGCFVSQVKSSTGDDVFSDADYRRAIDATENDKSITDLTVCNRFEVLGHAKLSVAKMSGPFVGGERLLWQGMPAGSPIGDANTPGSIVYTAKVSLRTYGSGPDRGRQILLGNTWANRQIILEDGTPTTVTVDGSFIAGYAASRQAAFDRPIETLLRKDTASFSNMQEFEEGELDTLGGASVLFLYNVGPSQYRFGESHTVDTGSPDVNEISAMTQKDYVTRRVRRNLDENLVGLVPPSPAAGVIQIQSYLVQELADIASSGFIAPYGSEETPPVEREIEPGSDTFVYVDERDRRRYHLGYFFNILYPIKWIMGLYSVDARFWDNRSLNSGQ